MTISSRLHYLARAGYEIADSLTTAHVIEQKGVEVIFNEAYRLPMTQWQVLDRQLTLLCQDGEIHVSQMAQCMLGVQGNIMAVAVAEKRDVVLKFLEFLEERKTPIDVLIRKYGNYNFVSFSQAVQCIVGQLLKHIISPSD